MRPARLGLIALTLSIGIAVLAARDVETAPTSPTSALDELWVEPADLERRDLFRGPALGPTPPKEQATFTFVEDDTTGRSPGYDVRDSAGLIWSVKLGPEAQSEVVSSRILWAIGFHQPPNYFLRKWQVSGLPPRAAGEEDLEAWGGRDLATTCRTARRPAAHQQLGLEGLEQQGLRSHRRIAGAEAALCCPRSRGVARIE
jgi:hypothetical protein